MKIKCIVKLVFISVLFLGPSLSQARISIGSVPDKPKRESGGDEYFGSIVRYGAGLDWASFQPNSKGQYANGSGALVHFFMEYKTRFAIEIDYGSYDLDVHDTENLGAGTAKVKPLTIGILYNFNPESSLVPYLMGGFGLYSASSDLQPSTQNEWNLYGYQYDAQIHNGLGYHAGVGAKFYPRQDRRISLNIEYRNIWFKPDVEFYLRGFGYSYGPYKTNVDMSGQIVKVGASIYF